MHYTRLYWLAAPYRQKLAVARLRDGTVLHALAESAVWDGRYVALRKVECGTYQRRERIAEYADDVTCPKCLAVMERREKMKI